jgi:hypothetical protein
MKRSIPAVAAAVAFAIAGCGGSSSNSSGASLSAFKSGFQSQKHTFSALGVDLRNTLLSVKGQSNATIASEFSSLASRATASAKALRTLKPPAKYSAQLTQLASGFDTVAADLQSLSSAAAKDDIPSARQAIEKIGTDSKTVHSADLALSQALGLPTTG